MNKDKLSFVITFLAVVLASFLFALVFFYHRSLVCFDDNCFKVEIAKTQEEISQGLMFRDLLDQDAGMLFAFSKEGEYSFWMKNTLIPLDIIWIDENNKVVYIKEFAEPCKVEDCPVFNPSVKALYVLEVNAGIAKQIGLKIGDTLILK